AYLPAKERETVLARLGRLPGIERVLDREAACAELELPPDRIGDIVVISERHAVIGTSRARHDLSGLDAPLRSHGGLSEQQVPLLLNRPVRSLAPAAPLRNLDIFHVALNHAQQEAIHA